MFQEFISSPLSLLTITVALYSIGSAIYRRARVALCHPVLLTFLAMIGFLTAFNIPYEQYREATKILDFCLGMSVVALGYLLYEQEERMREVPTFSEWERLSDGRLVVRLATSWATKEEDVEELIEAV